VTLRRQGIGEQEVEDGVASNWTGGKKLFYFKRRHLGYVQRTRKVKRNPDPITGRGNGRTEQNYNTGNGESKVREAGTSGSRRKKVKMVCAFSFRSFGGRGKARKKLRLKSPTCGKRKRW